MIYLTLLVLFSKSYHLDKKKNTYTKTKLAEGKQRFVDVHTAHTKNKRRIQVGTFTKHKFRQTARCVQTQIWVNADECARTWISQVVAVFHQTVFLHSIQPVEPLSPDTLTPSPK